MPVSDFVWLFFILCLLSFIFLASYRSPSLTSLMVEFDQETTPLVGPPVDKECIEQVYKYLFKNAGYIIDACGWTFVRFYIAWHFVSFVMDDVVKPIVKSLAKKAYRAFYRYWFRNDRPQ